MPYQQKIYLNPDLFPLKVDFVTLKPDFLTLKFKVQKSTLREENLLLRRKNLVLSRFFYRNLTFRNFVPRHPRANCWDMSGATSSALHTMCISSFPNCPNCGCKGSLSCGSLPAYSTPLVST